MPFVMKPTQNNSNRQQKDDIEFSLTADSGIQSRAGSTQLSPTSQNSNPYENRALFPQHQLQSHILSMTPMPTQAPEVSNPIRDS